MGWKFFKGNLAKQVMTEANEAAISITLEQVGEQADAQVPLDEGTLKNSKFIQVEGNQGMISYGGGAGTESPKIPYAIRWHEEDANFQRGRKNRYLADPLNNYGVRLYRRNLTEQIGTRFK